MYHSHVCSSFEIQFASHHSLIPGKLNFPFPHVFVFHALPIPISRTYHTFRLIRSTRGVSPFRGGTRYSAQGGGHSVTCWGDWREKGGERAWRTSALLRPRRAQKCSKSVFRQSKHFIFLCFTRARAAASGSVLLVMVPALMDSND